MHLKAIQRMNDQVQRPIGVPPLSNPRFEQAIMAGATGLVASTSTTTSGSAASHAPLSTHSHPPSTMMMMTTSEIRTPQFKNGLQSTGATAVESSYSSSSAAAAAVFPLSSGYHSHPHGSSSGQIRVMDNHHNCNDIDDDGDDVDQHHHHRNPEQNRIKNPLSGMGEQYTMILQNIVNGDGLIMNELPMNGSTADPSSSSNLILSPSSSSSLLLPPSLSSSLMGGGSSSGEKRGYEEGGLLDGSLSGSKEKKRSRFEVIE